MYKNISFSHLTLEHLIEDSLKVFLPFNKNNILPESNISFLKTCDFNIFMILDINWYIWEFSSIYFWYFDVIQKRIGNCTLGIFTIFLKKLLFFLKNTIKVSKYSDIWP